MVSDALAPDVPAFARICFPLKQDEDGYPGIGAETLWAIKVGSGFKIDNIPFYAYGVSCGDVVAAEPNEAGLPEFREVIEPSFHSTLRVILRRDCADQRPPKERLQELAQRIMQLGCDIEVSSTTYFAIDVPPQVKLDSVRGVLDAGESEGLWGYEESCLWHQE